MLAQKGTRKINVNGKVFSWRVTYKAKKLRLVIQCYKEKGQFLIFSVPFIDPWLKLGLRFTDSEPSENQVELITPSFVKQVILFAVENDWSPESKKSPYTLTIKNGNFIAE